MKKSKLSYVVPILLVVFLQGCTKEDPKVYVKDLYSRDLERRLTGGYELLRIGEEAVPLLIEELKSEEPVVRYIAAQLLGRIKDRRAVVPLTGALKDISPGVRARAAEALGKLEDERAIDTLIQAASDTTEELRAKAIEALGGCRSDTAYHVVISALDDPSTEVQVMAMVALGRYKYEDVLEKIIQLAGSDSARVRFVAVQALGKIKIRNDRAILTLVRALGDPFQSVRISAAKSLANIGDRRAIEPLERFYSRGTIEERRAASYALEKIAGKKYVLENW